ncbi:MAG: hypothetical protein J6T22_12635 [Bacteroidales bacterium]|nr:hypothetical protein [Bacteroidales bacterium]
MNPVLRPFGYFHILRVSIATVQAEQGCPISTIEVNGGLHGIDFNAQFINKLPLVDKGELHIPGVPVPPEKKHLIHFTTVLLTVGVQLLELRSVEFMPFCRIVLTVNINNIVSPVEALRPQIAFLNIQTAALRLLIRTHSAIKNYSTHDAKPSFAFSSSIWSPARK